MYRGGAGGVEVVGSRGAWRNLRKGGVSLGGVLWHDMWTQGAGQGAERIRGELLTLGVGSRQ